MRTNYSLLFYLKKPKQYISGPAPLYMRITVDGITPPDGGPKQTVQQAPMKKAVH